MVDPKIISHPHGDRTFTSTLYYGADVRESLRTLPDQSVQCAVTSPPYWGLRSYLPEGSDLKGSEIGTESTPDEYVSAMVDVFREVRRVLRDDGVLWLNIGDSYVNRQFGWGRTDGRGWASVHKHTGDDRENGRRLEHPMQGSNAMSKATGIKNKDLAGIPWMLAFALRADNWYLRSDVIWAKGSCMPESVTDRPTRSHEYVFLLTKSQTYFYDADAIKEPSITGDVRKPHGPGQASIGGRPASGHREDANVRTGDTASRNRRTVWTINPRPYKGAHFATMPPALAEVCVKAGSRAGDTVLDPFSGSGTTGYVANRLGRHYVGTDLNPDYLPLAEARLMGMDPPESDDEATPEGEASILDLL